VSDPRFAVIGQPIRHSRSPELHRHFARLTGIALSYEAQEVAPGALSSSLNTFFAQGFRGLNVTLPHKLEAAKLCHRLSARAQRAEAVNTLVWEAAGWYGDNTDGEGFRRDLLENCGIELAGKRVLVLGAGGAVRGILMPLLEARPAELVVSNRTPWRPDALAQAFKDVGVIRPCTHLALKGDCFDVIVQATSAGHEGGLPRLPAGLLAPGGACYDLNYGKAALPFCAWAEAQGATRIADGLGMLVEQAAEAFSLWHGLRPPTAAVIEAARHATVTPVS
jgi:shikimate dehydrogenase